MSCGIVQLNPARFNVVTALNAIGDAARFASEYLDNGFYNNRLVKTPTSDVSACMLTFPVLFPLSILENIAIKISKIAKRA